MKYVKYVFILTLVLTMIGCSMFQSKSKTAVFTYDVVGNVLIEFQRRAKPLCENGTIKAQDCIELQNRYNQARSAFLTAGDILAKHIDDPDALATFSASMEEINKILPIIMDIMSKYGIKIQGGNK